MHFKHLIQTSKCLSLKVDFLKTAFPPFIPIMGVYKRGFMLLVEYQQNFMLKGSSQLIFPLLNSLLKAPKCLYTLEIQSNHINQATHSYSTSFSYILSAPFVCMYVFFPLATTPIQIYLDTCSFKSHPFIKRAYH